MSALSDIATPLTHQVLELRRRRGELGPCALDSVNRRLYHLPSVLVQREAFIADRETAVDQAGRVVAHED